MKKGITKFMAALIALLFIVAAGVSIYFYTARSRGVTLTVVVVSGWNQQTVEMAAQDYEKLNPSVHFNFVLATFSSVEEKEIVAES
ncbi:MAG: hypothetical protein ACP5GO_02645 [Thermoprotei archaeon]|jgi:ABC-type glycerol-3-phosphate transport system substrate-binding protein